MNTKTVILTALAGLCFLSACSNTVHGAGRDIENAGESVQRTVE